MKKLTLLATIIAVLALLTTCSEPIDFLEEVTTEVKIANDLFLEVENIISPPENALSVNPGSEIIIQFDRQINMDSVTSANLI
jgi:hypothetical protein